MSISGVALQPCTSCHQDIELALFCFLSVRLLILILL